MAARNEAGQPAVAEPSVRLGLTDSAYRREKDWQAKRVLAVAVFVLAAAGGGYILTQSRGPEAQTIAAGRETAPAATQPTNPVAAPQGPAALATAAAPVPAASASPVNASVETAMLARAELLMRGRDLAAARVVLVVLARKGSAAATRRLAESYDPTYLYAHQIEGVMDADIERAKRLYAAAARRGDAAANERLRTLLP